MVPRLGRVRTDSVGRSWRSLARAKLAKNAENRENGSCLFAALRVSCG